MIEMAKALGMKTMLGCMVSSSVHRHGGGAPLAAGGLRRPGRQPADRQRSLPGREGGQGQTDPARRPGLGLRLAKA